MRELELVREQGKMLVSLASVSFACGLVGIGWSFFCPKERFGKCFIIASSFFSYYTVRELLVMVVYSFTSMLLSIVGINL